MEKQRNTERRRFVSGLLIILFSLCTDNLWAASKITAAQIRELKIKPAPNEKLITDSDIKFELDIPSVEASNVEITTPTNTNEIIFKTLRKTPISQNTDNSLKSSKNSSSKNSGVKIELWYEFTKSGERKPEPLGIKILNKNYKIPFEYVLIEENPINLSPRMIYKFSNGKSISSIQKDSATPIFSTPVSKPLTFTVYVQYTNQVTYFNYEIPKNSLFQLTKSYPIDGELVPPKNTAKKEMNTENGGDFGKTIVTNDLIPIAEFEWTPITKGKAPIPEIKLTTISITGNKVDLKMPSVFINVTSKQTGKDADNLTAFANQFEETIEETVEEEILTADPLLEIESKRKLYQKLIIVSLFLISLFFLIIIFAFTKIKKSKIAKNIFIASIFLAVLSLAGLIISTVILKQPVAIYTGGIIKSIPEENAGNHIQIMENSQVKIIKETADWYCIQANGNVGWTKKDNIDWK